MKIIRRLFGSLCVPRGTQNNPSLSKDDKRHLYPEFNFKVHVTDERIRVVRPDGKEESVTWNALKAVVVETNDTGPWGTDVLWLLIGEELKSGCVIPQGADGEKELLNRLQALPGFDNEALIEAMGSASNRKFLCWERPPNHGVQQDAGPAGAADA